MVVERIQRLRDSIDAYPSTYLLLAQSPREEVVSRKRVSQDRDRVGRYLLHRRSIS